MNDTEHHDIGTALMDASNSYELKHILSAAAAYLDTGQVDDAEDLLQEARDVGGEHPDVAALVRRLDHARGRTSADAASRVEAVGPMTDILVNFTRPLPGVENQTPAVQRLIREAEGHYAGERLYAALDSTYLACVEAPDFVPAFVRLAELQLALGNAQQAWDLFGTLSSWHDAHDTPPSMLVRSLQVSLEPNNTRALLDYATTLVDSGDISTLEPYVPAAIARAVESNPAAARALSERYLERHPKRPETQQLHLRIMMTIGDPDALLAATRDLITPSSPLDVLVYRVIAEAISTSEDWLVWLERLAVSLHSDPASHAMVREVFRAGQGSIAPERFALLSGVAAFSAGMWQECVDTLRFAAPAVSQSQTEVFAGQMTLALALGHLNEPSATGAMLDAAKIALHADVETFASSTQLFGVSVSPAALLSATMAHGGAAIAELQTLRDAHPARLEVRSALADVYLRSGQTHEAVRELRYIAQEHEKTGHLRDMVGAMRQISQAVPENLEMKAKLIEGYLRRGVLDEAMAELDLIGGLYHERNRTADAVAAFTRAAEIASATGAFDEGNALFHKAVEAAPDNVPVRHAAVAFYLQTGSIRQATEQLREVVRIALLTDDRDEAVAALHQIIALAPQDPDAYHKLGEVLTLLGEYTQAERVYRRLATFSPDDPVLEAKQSALAVLAATK